MEDMKYEKLVKNQDGSWRDEDKSKLYWAKNFLGNILMDLDILPRVLGDWSDLDITLSLINMREEVMRIQEHIENMAKTAERLGMEAEYQPITLRPTPFQDKNGTQLYEGDRVIYRKYESEIEGTIIYIHDKTSRLGSADNWFVDLSENDTAPQHLTQEEAKEWEKLD